MIPWKLLIFFIWPIEQKMFLFDHIIDIGDEPARPGPTRPGLLVTLSLSVIPEDTIWILVLKLSNQILDQNSFMVSKK